jgi:hypothetical protein
MTHLTRENLMRALIVKAYKFAGVPDPARRPVPAARAA